MTLGRTLRALALTSLTLACSSSGSMTGSASDGGSLADAASMCSLGLPLSVERCEQVRALALPEALPKASGNRYADDDNAAYLGFLMFFDQRFSSTPEVRCATCHLPENGFVERKAVSEVIPGRPLTRNSLSILNAAWSGPYYFWDGRADSLWSQPLFALESPDEMNGSRLALAHALYDTPTYRARYEQLFGPLPDLSDSAHFPLRGKPGEASYDTMSGEDRAAIDRVFANYGKALEAYMRKVATGPSGLEQFLAGDRAALDEAAQRGLTTFANEGCIDCHSGPSLSDGTFHALGTGSDRGRAGAIAILLDNPFSSSGAYWDIEAGARPTLPSEPLASDEGAFRTPTLRNIARTAPYGHDGAHATLEQLLETGHGAQLDEAEINDVVFFLMSLNGRYPARPYGDWPAR
jgi:cytochrome c peroxidase